MASSSASNNENNCEKDTTSSSSITLQSTRARRLSRENQLLHRTRSGGVDRSSSPQSITRKSKLLKNHSSKTTTISSTNVVNDVDTSEDTDEDSNKQTNTSLSIKTSGILV
jgi:hypothetical protein